MQKEAAFSWVADILVSMTSEMNPVVLLHCIEYSCGSRLMAYELGVLCLVVCMSLDVCELQGCSWQWVTTMCSRLANCKNSVIFALWARGGGERSSKCGYVGQYSIVEYSRSGLTIVSSHMQR